MRSHFDPAMICIREMLQACATFSEIAQAVKADEYEIMLAYFDQKSISASLSHRIMDFHSEYFKAFNRLNNIQLIEKYTSWLNNSYDSLKFTWNDMAKSAGISKTLLKQYYNGISSPLTARNAKKSNIHARICDYLMSLYTCDIDADHDTNSRYKFIRLPNKMFGSFLRELLNAFSYTMNQSQLAERIGLSQGKISRIVNGSYIITTQKQYEILKIFDQLCGEHYEVYSPLYQIASRLKKYLFIEDYSEACCFNPISESYMNIEQEILEEKLEETRESRLLICRFLQYPSNVQAIILQCRNIFSNDIYEISAEQYDRFMQVIEMYRNSLSDPQKTSKLFARLNDTLNTRLVFDNTGSDLFDTMADYLKITAYTKKHGAVLDSVAVKKLVPIEKFCDTEPDISGLSNENNTIANRFIHIFRKDLLIPVRCFENMLRFTAEEWEICRLITLGEYSKSLY